MPHDQQPIDPYETPAPAADETVIDARPRCPGCGAPRMTCCPICQTAGYDFPQADPRYVVSPDAIEAEGPVACSCHGGCGKEGAEENATGADANTDIAPDDAIESVPPTMLVCTTCDEPFVPQYLKRCEWCGYTFADGIELELPDDPTEPMNMRIIVVFFTLAMGALALLIWLASTLQ